MQYVVALVLLLAALVLLRGMWHVLSEVFSGLGNVFSSPGHVLGLVVISLAIVGVIMLVFYETTVYLNRQRFRPLIEDGESLLPPSAVSRPPGPTPTANPTASASASDAEVPPSWGSPAAEEPDEPAWPEPAQPAPAPQPYPQTAAPDFQPYAQSPAPAPQPYAQSPAPDSQPYAQHPAPTVAEPAWPQFDAATATPSAAAVAAEEVLLSGGDPHQASSEPVGAEAAWADEPVPAEITDPAEAAAAEAAGEAVEELPPLFAPRITPVLASDTPTPLPKRTPLNGKAPGNRATAAAANGNAAGSTASGGGAAGAGLNGGAAGGGLNGGGAAGAGLNGGAADAGLNGGGAADAGLNGEAGFNGGGTQGSDWLANARLLIAPDPVRDDPFPRALESGEHGQHGTLSFYPFTVRVPKLELEARLRSPEVRQAAGRLAEAPDSDNLRLALVTALTSDSDNLFLNEPAVVLRVTTIRAEGGPVRDRLDRVVLLTTGAKLGDRTDHEGHRIRAVDPTPEARSLLSGHSRLASALVNAAFPVEGADTAALDQRLVGTIDALDLDSSIRSRPTPPADGTPLEIDGLSGATSSNQSVAS